MTLSPGFIYWDVREWEANDVYIKFYGKENMPVFLYGRYIHRWWFRMLTAHFIASLDFTARSEPNGETRFKSPEWQKRNAVFLKEDP